jgi:hypothetical protein
MMMSTRQYRDGTRAEEHMVWYNNPESVEAIQTAQRVGYRPEQTRLLRLVRTQKQLQKIDH